MNGTVRAFRARVAELERDFKLNKAIAILVAIEERKEEEAKQRRDEMYQAAKEAYEEVRDEAGREADRELMEEERHANMYNHNTGADYV